MTSNRGNVRDEWTLRNLVGRWLRVRAEHVADSVGIVGAPYLSVAEQKALLTQLAADAEHSDLLVRLFRGEEPRPFGEWKSGL